MAARSKGANLKAPAWQPLNSGDAELDRLWRLDQRDEAWETWRSRRLGRPPRQPAELLLEGRLRQGVGDDWTGADVMLSFPAEIAVMQGAGAQFPKLAAFVAAVHARPAWQRAREKGGAYYGY